MTVFQVDFRTRGKLNSAENPMALANCALADELLPVRLAASFKGQRSMPGFFWMSRMNCLLMYESKLEMITLLQLDFNTSVKHVVPQPFIMYFTEGKKQYRHTPDFFARHADGSGEVINVKPKKYVTTERNRRSFSACQSLSNEMGFSYSTKSEPDAVLLENLWWLSGYRLQPARFDQFSEYLVESAANSMTIGQIMQNTASPILLRPVLFFLLWTRILEIDLYSRMSKNTKVNLSGGVRHAK